MHSMRADVNYLRGEEAKASQQFEQMVAEYRRRKSEIEAADGQKYDDNSLEVSSQPDTKG